MEQVIEVEPRGSRGKGEARKLRNTGRIPGVLYGHKEKCQTLSVDPKLLRRLVEHSGYGQNTIFRVKGLEREVLARVKEAQVDRVARKVLHVDFQEVREDDLIDVEIPVKVHGRAAGVALGGTLQVVRRSLKARCRPLDIPQQFELDVSGLGVNDTLSVSKVPTSDKVELTEPKQLTVVMVHPPRVAATKGEEDGKKK